MREDEVLTMLEAHPYSFLRRVGLHPRARAYCNENLKEKVKIIFMILIVGWASVLWLDINEYQARGGGGVIVKLYFKYCRC